MSDEEFLLTHDDRAFWASPDGPSRRRRASSSVRRWVQARDLDDPELAGMATDIALQVRDHDHYPQGGLTDDKVRDIVLRPPYRQVWLVCDADGHCVGMVGASAVEDWFWDPRFAEPTGLAVDEVTLITRLMVHPELRGQGVALRLLADAIGWAERRPESIAATVPLGSTALRLLRHHGFAPVVEVEGLTTQAPVHLMLRDRRGE